jgi:protein MAK16
MQIERSHMPSKWWEKIKLSGNYQQALQQIEERLQYFPKFLLHKCKQRLTRLIQVATRVRKIAAEEARLGEQLVPKMAPKIKHREEARERKALMAAKLERTIERELLERLRQGAYGDQPLNCNDHIWKKVLNALEAEGEGSRDKDMDKGIEDEDEEVDSEAELEHEREEEDEEEDGAVEYVSDFDESDDELADLEDWLGSEEDDDEEDDDEEDSDEEEAKKTTKAGDKRKRGRAVKPKARKKKEMEVERETERSKLLAF